MKNSSASLRRLYVDNYKSLVNFDLKLDRMSLLLGENGAGKSTVFKVLSTLRAFIVEEKRTDELFPSSCLTRWQSHREQTFEVYVKTDSGEFCYRLVVAHMSDGSSNRVATEELTFDGKPLFEFNLGKVRLYRDNHSEGPEYTFDWHRSALALVGTGNDNVRLTWFREWIRRILVVWIDPRQMDTHGAKERVLPSDGMGNFVSWYRHLVLDSPGELAGYFQSLKDVFAGFEVLRLVTDGEQRALRIVQQLEMAENSENQTVEYALDEISDGQRALIALYALRHFALHSEGLLCIDEPGNFIALPELQPWLLELNETSIDRNAQVVMISHHPDAINLLAPSEGLVLERKGGGPTRCHSFSDDPRLNSESGMLPAEAIVRGNADA